MLKIFLMLFVSFAAVSSADSSDTELAEVPCRIYLDFFYVAVGNSYVCLIDVFKPEFDQRYRIKSERNEKVTGIDIRNWKIQYAPSYISENFPNMEIYAATANAIKQIGPENFRGLHKMRAIYLSHNRLEEIPAETFAGLNALQHLHLQYNKIKFIDTSAISGLNKLIAIHIDHNDCINQTFLMEDAFEQFVETAAKQCSDEKMISNRHDTNKDEL